MGEGQNVSGGRFDEHDPDALWRRRADASPDPPTDTETGALAGDASPAESSTWSRDHRERPGAQPVQVPIPLVDAGDQPATPAAPRPSDPKPVSPRRSVSGSLGLVVGSIVTLAVILVVATVVRRPGATESTAPLLPSSATLSWTHQFDDAVEAAAVGDGVVVVGTAAGVTALALDDGEVLWHSDGDPTGPAVERIAVMGDRVVVQQQSPTGDNEVRSIDRLSGNDAWRSAGDGNVTLAGPADDPLLVRRNRVDDATVLELIDPLDGMAIGEPVRMSGVTAVDGHLGIQPARRKVAVWSIDTNGLVAGPVDSFNLRTVAPLDGSIVALDLDGRIVAFDEQGTRTDELPLVGAGGDEGDGASARFDLAGIVPTARIGIVAGDSSTGFTVADGRIEAVWRRDGRVTSPVATVEGDRSLLIAGADAGAIRETVIDPATGRTIGEIRVARRERVSMLGRNGYVVAPAVEDPERVVEGFGYDGRRLWSLVVPPEADYEVVGGVVMLVEETSAGGSVSIAR